MSVNLKWLPVIEETLCTGCGVCVEACGPRSLTLVEKVAMLSSPDSCGSEEHCIAPCPDEAIYMDWIHHEGNPLQGKWRVAIAHSSSSNYSIT